jgi:hypothetical protein
MRKDVFLSATIDTEAARILRELAERETEGNCSLALRRVLREAGERRGLLPANDKREVRHVQAAA